MNLIEKTILDGDLPQLQRLPVFRLVLPVDVFQPGLPEVAVPQLSRAPFIGLIQAFDQIKSDIPVIVRLTGTNEHIGRDLLRSHSRFQIATTMQEAALMAIKS